MPVTIDANGVPWLEPQHLDARVVAQDIGAGLSMVQIKLKYGISDSDWNLFSVEIAKAYREPLQANSSDAQRVSDVNQKLAPLALALPSYLTVGELGRIEALLSATPIDEKVIVGKVLALAILPDLRAVQLHGRFISIPLFREFAYIIDSAAFSFYRGNIASCLFSIIPVIEGVLLRWQGFPNAVTKKPSFAETIQFLKSSGIRQPTPGLPLFFDTAVTSATKILEDHLFKPTTSGKAYDFFNRHLALHLLDDQPFCTADNARRAFLLLDVLSDIYVYETRSDPRLNTNEEMRKRHREAYIQTIMSSLNAGHPEHLLNETHSKYGSKKL